MKGGETVTPTSCPAVAVPCGFDDNARLVAPPIVTAERGEAAGLVVATMPEQVSSLHRLLPIDPQAETVRADW